VGEGVGGGLEAGEGTLALVFGFFVSVFLPLVFEVLWEVFVSVFTFPYLEIDEILGTIIWEEKG
jgi:hypothetical protein